MRGAMFHLVARTHRHAPLWTTWAQGRALWDRILRVSPGRVALVLMPDHVHLVHPTDIRPALAQALAGHTRSTGVGPLEPLPPARPLVDAQKVRRNVRYIHLNPCRARLCGDPLEWPLSTHRDACGLMIEPAVPARNDALRFHRYVSSDPTVGVQGTELPGDALGTFPPFDILQAVSAVTRAPIAEVRRKSPARRLYLAAARELSGAASPEIAAVIGVHRTSVGRASAPRAHILKVRRVLADPRFGALDAARLPWVER